MDNVNTASLRDKATSMQSEEVPGLERPASITSHISRATDQINVLHDCRSMVEDLEGRLFGLNPQPQEGSEAAVQVEGLTDSLGEVVDEITRLARDIKSKLQNIHESL